MSDPVPGLVAQQILGEISDDFSDDGCSNSPDSILWRSIKWCCRIHDWRYCSRCHRAGSMNRGAQTWADTELGMNIRSALPFTTRWVGWLYYRVTNRFGGMGAWNSCGPNSGLLCRHGMEVPEWMAELQDWAEG